MTKAKAKPTTKAAALPPPHPLDRAVNRLCELMEDYPHDWDSRPTPSYAYGVYYSEILFRKKHVLTRRLFRDHDPILLSEMWDAKAVGADLTHNHSIRLSEAWAAATAAQNRAQDRDRAHTVKLACDAFEASVHALTASKNISGEVRIIEEPQPSRAWWRFW